MIAGIGVDIVDLSHIKDVSTKQPHFCKYVLTEEELAVYETYTEKRQLEFLAGRYAAKEAFSKAMGTGIGKTVNFQNISILNDKKGGPYIEESPFEGNIFISISHSKYSAVAQVILETV